METAWLSTREASAELGITLRTLYRIIDHGQLPCYPFGHTYRLKRSDVERFRQGGAEAGVREPRRPRPSLDSGSHALDPPV